MNMKSLPLLAILACALGAAAAPQARAADRDIDCKLKYSLTGWSLIYKHTSGRGVVTCNNGQSMPVLLSANAGVAKSAEAQVLTKGPVSLALAGAGEGVNIGVDIGQFKIKPAR
jgi:hypothetical protein